GTGASIHSMLPLSERLRDRFTVVIPDLPGHAGSRADPAFRPTLPAMAAATGELLRSLGHASPAVLLGHSAGAAIAIQLLLDHPAFRPRLLVGLNAALVPFRGPARVVFPALAQGLARSRLATALIARRTARPGRTRRILRSTGTDDLTPAHVDAYRELAGRPDHVRGVLRMMAHWDLESLFDRLPSLQTQVLLIAAADDAAVPLAMQRRAHARMANAKFAVLERGGHLVHERHPERIEVLLRPLSIR
ncbi:MAG: alpha/beta fold hydrolase BchO, partial [Myxococcota bacterium]